MGREGEMAIIKIPRINEGEIRSGHPRIKTTELGLKMEPATMGING